VTPLAAVLALFAGSWPLWVPLLALWGCWLCMRWAERRADALIANQPPPDAPNFDEWPWADDALALGNGDDFRDWERELRGGVR
jgi:hypothetical protein